MTEFLAEAHPFTVHFAISLVIMSTVFDLLALASKRNHFSTTAFSLAIAAVPFLLGAVLTGNSAETVYQAIDPVALSRHTTYANIAVWGFSIIVFARIWFSIKKTFKSWMVLLYIAVAVGLSIAVFLTGMEGGRIRDNSFRSDVVTFYGTGTLL